MKRHLTILITLLTYVTIVCGQINVLDLKLKKKFSEKIIYNRDKEWTSITTYIFYSNLRNPNKNYTHQLGISFRSKIKMPLHQKINLKLAEDSIKYYYEFLSLKTLNDEYRLESGLFDGTIEFLELTDSTVTFNVDFTLIDDKGKNLKYFYQGQRICKKEKIPTREEKSSKLLQLGLDSLIKRFDANWDLYETGKAYWIGYNDEMYAIASKKDTAINKLVNYINSTKKLNSKIGAIYCLHLIGIDSKIVGRFEEKFTNAKAREALLSLTSQKDLTSLIVSLLARDPWPTDLPTLVKLLKGAPNKTLVNALFRYSGHEMSFRQNISSSIDTFNVVLKDSSGTHHIGKIVTDNGRTNIIFFPNKAEIKTIKQHFSCSISEIKTSKCEEVNQMFDSFFRLSEEKVSVFSYCTFRDKFFHYLTSPNEIIVCDVTAAQQKWLDFFKTNGL
jgi:hypothetical protein